MRKALLIAALIALAGCETVPPAAPPPPDPKTQMAALETRIAALVEEQRQKLDPKAKVLAIDPELAKVARARAADMAATLSGVLGQPVSYVDIPEDAARQQMGQAGLPDYVTDGLLETYRLIRAGRFAYTTDTVQHVTGQPPRTFRQWCEQHRDAFG